MKSTFFALLCLIHVGCSAAAPSSAERHYPQQTTWNCTMSADLAAKVTARTFTELGFSSLGSGEPDASVGRPVKPLYADALTARILAQTANQSRIGIRFSLDPDETKVTLVDMRSDLTPVEQHFVLRSLLMEFNVKTRDRPTPKPARTESDGATTQPYH